MSEKQSSSRGEKQVSKPGLFSDGLIKKKRIQESNANNCGKD
jgi:hypothetical protein